MILIGRGLDFRRLTEKQFSEEEINWKKRSKQEKKTAWPESFDVQLSGYKDADFD